MDFQSKLVNFLNTKKKEVQQVFNQAPQAINSFGNNLRQQVQPIMQQGQAAFWNKSNPVANTWLNLQKATPAFQQGGVDAFDAGNFLRNNRSIADYIPRFQAPQSANLLQKAPSFIANMPIEMGANIVGRAVVDPITDIGRLWGNAAQGQQAPQYDQLKSPLVRAGYNTTGINNTPQQMLGNTAGVITPILDAYSGGFLGKLGKTAFQEAGKQTFKKLLTKGALEGGTAGTIYGGLQGLIEGRDKTLEEQLKGTAQNAVLGAGLGFVGGGALSGASTLLGKILNKTPEVIGQLRDAGGRWVKGQTPVKPKGMAKAAWDFQIEFNKKYKRNPYTPVYPEDIKKAVTFELEQKGAGLSIKDVTKELYPTQQPKQQLGDVVNPQTANQQILPDNAGGQLEIPGQTQGDNAFKLNVPQTKVKPQAQIQKEVGGYDIASEPRVQGQMRGLTEKGRQMTIDAERSRRPVISEPDMPYILKRAGASPEDIASGKITVYRATENGRILPGDFVTPDKSVLKPYFDQRVETGRNPKIITQKVDVKDLVIGDEVTDFVYRPQSPLKSQPNVANPLLSDISKTTSTPQHNLKMAKESGRSFEDLLKDSPEMLKGRTGFDTPPQTVKVYRGVSQEGRNIRSGDWVTTNPEYAKKYGGVVQELEVSAKDLKYMNGSAQGNAMGEFPEYIYTGKFSGQKPVSPLGLTVGESNVGSVGNTTPEILVKNPPTKEVFHNPIVPQKQFTQLGSATNTRADQIAGKFRTNQTIQPQQSYIPETPQPRLANVKGVATSLISDTEAQRVLKNQEIKRTAQEMPQSDSQSTKQSGGIIPSNDDIIANARKEIGRVDKPNNAGLKETIRTAADKFYTDWIDRYHPIMKMVGGVEKQGKKLGFDIIPKNNPKYTIRRFLGMGGIAEERYDRELKPILDELDKLKIDKTDMDVYLKARRDVGFGDIGRDIFGSDANLGAARVRAIEQKYGEAIKPIADKLYAYQSKGFDDLVDAGFVAKDKSNLIKSQNPDYVPFIRKMDDQLDEFLGIPTKVAQQKANPLKKIEGSERAIYSPIESVVVNTFKQRAAIEKNNVAKSIVGLQKIMPELGFERASKEGAGVITVWENGQKNLYQVGGEIAEAVKGMNEEQINGWMKTMTIPASIMRQGATGRNPEFMIPNVVRDQLDAAMNSKYGYIPFVDWAKGLSHVLKQDEVYSKWKSSGASMSFSKLSGRKNIQEMYDEKLVKKKAIEKLGSFLGKGLDKLGQLSEEPTRVGLFNKAYKKTGNELIANLEARESSMDFSRMGSKMKVANSVIPFLNVGIQGFDKMIRTARENPAKFTALMGLYGATPAIATAVYNNTFHPEEYAKIPSYVREDNFIIVTGKDSEGNAEYISIPKGHTIQYIANPIDDFISYAANTNKQSLPAMLTQFLSSGTPVTGDGSTVKEVALKTIGQNLPQAIKPVTESLLNKSFFKYDTNSDEAKEIVPYYLKDKPAAEQAYDHTPAMYKGIARGLAQANINVSPLNIQNVMEGYLAGGSKIPANVIDMMIAAGEGKDVDKNKIPLLRRFLQKTYPIPERDKEITPEKVGLFNKASAAETTTPQTSEAIIAKNKQDDKDARAKIEKGSSAFLSNNKIYLDRDKNGSAETIDLTPPTKGTGIASFKNDNWKYSKAKSIWNDNSVPSDVKNLAFKQLGVKQEDVRYDALASYTVDEKAQYISAKSGTKEKLIENIKTGRKVSVSGAINASDGVIDKLVDEGRLTKAEAKELKKIDYNKDGTLKQAKSSGGSKKGSLKIDFRQFIRKAPKSKTYTAPKLAAPVKLKSVKARKLKDLSYKGKPLTFKKKTSTTYK